MLQLQCERNLTLSELINLFKLEKSNEIIIEKKSSNKNRMLEAISTYNSLCYILAEDKASELNAVNSLKVIDFINLIEKKRKSQEK